MSAALHDLPATALGTLYRHGDLSPVEVTRAVLARIDAWEPHLAATWALDAEAALAQARASEGRWRRGRPLGPLDGVPAMLKENIATRGLAVPLGSAATVLAPAEEDAPPAARLREAGAVLLGKTTMPDFGMLSSGLSSFHRLTRNPWNLACNPGGSSAGAAAGVAAGYGPLHVGTDIGGSVRLPASWCGVFALKPSLGRIPIRPAYAGRVAGPMTRTVADAALLMRELSRPDARDPTSLPVQPIDWDDLDLDPRGLRLGLQLDAGWGMALDPAVRAGVEEAARRFEAAGARVEPVAPFMTREMADGMDRFWRMRSWLDLSAMPPERQALVLPYIRAWVEPARAYAAAEVFHGQAQMAAMREAAVAATHRFDFVLSPVAPCVAFPAEMASPLDDPQRPFEHIAWTLPWNMSEQPAASVPTGCSAAGLPIGLQIIGRRHDDLGVLRLSRLWERLRDPLPAWPEPPQP